ncbi:MAG: alpha/beta hydrolase family protein [Planctomycetota bacterium]
MPPSFRRRKMGSPLLAILLCGTMSVLVSAQSPDEAATEMDAFKDTRWGPLKDLNQHFPFQPPETIESWEQRRADLQGRILVSAGLFPMPQKTKIVAHSQGAVERNGYRVEKINFETLPGLHLTGMLFRPLLESKFKAPYPAVLCPHGHGGRTSDVGIESARQQIVEGFERFEENARFPRLARCAQLARMGCVVFLYDMIGYGDNTQLSYTLAHRQAQARPHMQDDKSWGFYSPQAESRLQTIFGLQVWNSIHALDFLAMQDDVDTSRIAVTGNSGGGTQTLILCAIDDRPVAAFPNGMVSTSMQGGCYCENASLLRIGTGNVELTAVFAPKPLGMTSVNDWTRDMMDDGYPELQKLYELYGNKENVLCKAYPRFPHNYNHVTRCLMYRFMNRHLKLDLPEPIMEDRVALWTPAELAVWNDEHPRPPGGDDLERAVTAEFAARSEAALADLRNENVSKYRQLIRDAWRILIGRDLTAVAPVQMQVVDDLAGGAVSARRGRLIRQVGGRQEVIPLLQFGNGQRSAGRVSILLSGLEKSNLLGDDGRAIERVTEGLENQGMVYGIDLFGSGENLPVGMQIGIQRRVNDPREYCGFTYGYNPPRFARRVHDVLTLIDFVGRRHPGATIEIRAESDAVPIASVAALLSDGAVTSLHLGDDGFRFSEVESIWDAQFMPGAAKYGDLPGVLDALEGTVDVSRGPRGERANR